MVVAAPALPPLASTGTDSFHFVRFNTWLGIGVTLAETSTLPVLAAFSLVRELFLEHAERRRVTAAHSNGDTRFFMAIVFVFKMDWNCLAAKQVT